MTQTKNPHVLETESIGKLLIQYRFQYTHRCRWRCDQFYLLGTEG